MRRVFLFSKAIVKLDEQTVAMYLRDVVYKYCSGRKHHVGASPLSPSGAFRETGCSSAREGEAAEKAAPEKHAECLWWLSADVTRLLAPGWGSAPSGERALSSFLEAELRTVVRQDMG